MPRTGTCPDSACRAYRPGRRSTYLPAKKYGFTPAATLICPTGKIIAARSRSRGLAEQKPVAPEFIEPDQADLGRAALP